MARAFIALGANIGSPQAQVEEALERLKNQDALDLVRVSGLIRTPPWGKTDQPDFINAVADIRTELGPHAVLDTCLEIEKAMGRQRVERWGPRVIDLDLVAYDRLVFRSGRLSLPHPYAHERAFVLDPLREIAPEMANWIVAQANREAAKS